MQTHVLHRVGNRGDDMGALLSHRSHTGAVHSQEQQRQIKGVCVCDLPDQRPCGKSHHSLERMPHDVGQDSGSQVC